jgi:hypothetical protein
MYRFLPVGFLFSNKIAACFPKQGFLQFPLIFVGAELKIVVQGVPFLILDVAFITSLLFGCFLLYFYPFVFVQL